MGSGPMGSLLDSSGCGFREESVFTYNSERIPGYGQGSVRKRLSIRRKKLMAERPLQSSKCESPVTVQTKTVE